MVDAGVVVRLACRLTLCRCTCGDGLINTRSLGLKSRKRGWERTAARLFRQPEDAVSESLQNQLG